jgi:hypothetical protein
MNWFVKYRISSLRELLLLQKSVGVFTDLSLVQWLEVTNIVKTLAVLFVYAFPESVKKSVKECAVCEASMGAFDELLGDPNVQKDMGKLLKKVCPKLPAQDQNEVRSETE